MDDKNFERKKITKMIWEFFHPKFSKSDKSYFMRPAYFTVPFSLEDNIIADIRTTSRENPNYVPDDPYDDPYDVISENKKNPPYASIFHQAMLQDKELISAYVYRLFEEKESLYLQDEKAGCWFIESKPSMRNKMYLPMQGNDIHGTPRFVNGPSLYVAMTALNQDAGGMSNITLSALHLCKKGHLGCFHPRHLAFGTAKRNPIHEACYGFVSILQDDGMENIFPAKRHCKCPFR